MIPNRPIAVVKYLSRKFASPNSNLILLCGRETVDHNRGGASQTESGDLAGVGFGLVPRGMIG